MRGISTRRPAHHAPADHTPASSHPRFRLPAHALATLQVRDSLHLYLACGIFQETLVVHHACGVALYVVALATGAYHFPVAIVLIEEVCAPMVHLGWVLAKLKMDNHWLWDLNQYILIVSWIICRNGVDAILWFYLSSWFFE